MSFELPGPSGPITYGRDALGYPRVRAQNYSDATYAIGYLQATDRLTQIVILQLAARGRLMSVLGDKPLARLIDRSMRLMGGDSALQKQVEALDEPTRRLMQIYCAGFNAAVKERGWPLLLRLLGVKPFPYTEASIAGAFRLVTYFGLTSMQFTTELLVAELIARGAKRRLLERLLGRSLEGFEASDAQDLKIPPEFAFFNQPSGGSPMAGSNAFAVSAERSATGGALLMGEFHMEVGKWPPVVYACHVDLPEEQHICGMTVPGLAWFVAGRTKHVGWSYTFAHGDNVDVLMERVENDKYVRNGSRHHFRIRDEVLEIRGKGKESLRFYENDYGTLLGDARQEAVLPCVRFAGVAENYRSFGSGQRIVECRNVEELVAVHRDIPGVSLEAVMADSAGQIASVVTGQMDQRAEGWTGAYPRRGWDLPPGAPAPVSESQRPCVIRPQSGTLASANQGGKGEHRDAWCKFPEPRYREERIQLLLEKVELHDLSSLLRISYDTYDGSAERMLAVWGPLLPDELLAHALIDWQHEQKDPKLAALYTKLHEELYFHLLEEDLPRDLARQMNRVGALVFFENHIDEVLALEHPDLLDETQLRRLLQAAFRAAAESFEDGPYPVRMRFSHLLGQGKTPQWLGFDSAPVSLPGGPRTLFQCRFADVEGEPMVYGPAFHLAFDMSRPGAWYNLPGGASESRLGPGYGKGLQDWLNGVLIPLGHEGPSIRLTDAPGAHEGPLSVRGDPTAVDPAIPPRECS